MKEMPGAKSGLTPVIRMYGVTMDGNSLLCHVHGFVPYFFVPAQSFQQTHCAQFRDALNKAVIADMRSNKDNITQVHVCWFILTIASSLMFVNSLSSINFDPGLSL